MKKIFIYMAAASFVLAGCSKSEGPGAADGPVAIRLSSGIGALTKAPVISGPVLSGNVEVQIEGWENKAAEAYTGDSRWKSTAEVEVNAAAAEITLSEARYYHADENTSTYIKGWYPAVASSKGTVTFDNADGSVDVLYASEVSGNKWNLIQTPLLFKHKSTQLAFKIIAGEGLDKGTELKSIKLKNSAIPTSLKLSDGTVSYTPQAELAIPNVQVTELTDVVTPVGDPVMIQPVEDNTTIKLKIETTSALYDDVEFTTEDGQLAEGKAYTILLTFVQEGIGLQANITPWITANGEGTVK